MDLAGMRTGRACARQMSRRCGVFDRAFDKWSFPREDSSERELRVTAGFLLRLAASLAAASDINKLINPDIRKEALARIGR
jgi:hypothetical protein